VADLLTRLRAALGDRYQREREIGAGGMATVYLAEDVKHHRKVACEGAPARRALCSWASPSPREQDGPRVMPMSLGGQREEVS
jgi:serine/threonine protein kinase